MEPVTIGVALTVAGKAFEAIKKGFQVGRDIESMGGDLARWMGAASDVDNAERTAKNPSYLQRVFGGSSLEANAIEAVVAKKRETASFLISGINSYPSFLAPLYASV